MIYRKNHKNYSVYLLYIPVLRNILLRSTFTKNYVKTAVEFRAWMSNYILLSHIEWITYPCPNPDTGLANLCYINKRGPIFTYHTAFSSYFLLNGQLFLTVVLTWLKKQNYLILSYLILQIMPLWTQSRRHMWLMWLHKWTLIMGTPACHQVQPPDPTFLWCW